MRKGWREGRRLTFVRRFDEGGRRGRKAFVDASLRRLFQVHGGCGALVH